MNTILVGVDGDVLIGGDGNYTLNGEDGDDRNRWRQTPKLSSSSWQYSSRLDGFADNGKREIL